MSSGLTLGIGASLIWVAILFWSDRYPERRLWPPHRGGWVTAIWAWGLTALIYVGLIRVCAADWNVLELPTWIRWILGGGLSTWGSVIQTQGIAALGLKGTSGWNVGLVTRGAYARRRHPQYLGQIATLIGIALFAGSVLGWVVVVVGTGALLYAAVVEDRFWARRDPEFSNYAKRVGLAPISGRPQS